MRQSLPKFERKPALAIRHAIAIAAAVLMPAISAACFAQTTTHLGSARSSVQTSVVPGGMNTFVRAASDGTPLHIIQGHSIFIDSKTRFNRVYITDPSIVNSVTLTPTELVVTAMAPGVSSLTLLDESGQAQNYVISSDVDIDGLRNAMQQSMGSDSVKVEGSGSRVTLTGTVGSPAQSDQAAKLAALYARDVVNALVVPAPGHPKQVRLEVRILEVDRTKLQQWGINLFNPGGNTNFLATTTTSQFPSSATLGGASTSGGIDTVIPSNPLNFFLYSAKLNLGATIQDLENKQIAQILAEPTITTVSGVKADFLSGGEFPFPMIQPGGAGSAPVITISFRPYGVKLEFTPIVNPDGTITLTVTPEVSALDYSNSVNIGGFSVPALSTRRASTEVELRSDQSFAISGLLDQRTTDILDKTPGIASIPVLGALFKSKNINRQTTELIVVVTPTVVDPLTDSTVPDQPATPLPMLDRKQFDDSLGKNAVPNPKPPALTPDKPQMGNWPASAVPAAAPAATVPAPTAAVPAPANATPAAVSAPVPAPATAPSTQPAAVPASQPKTVATPATEVALVAAPDKPEAPVAASHPASAPADSAAAKPHSMVEVMALSHESDADAMVAALNRNGYNVAVHHEPQDSLLHLEVGPFANEKDAEAMRQKLLSDGYNATIR